MGSAKGLRQERFLTPGPVGSGRLSASWQPQSGPSTPSPVAAQFTSEGATLSGLDLELLGGGYRMSLVKRRFATGSYRAGLGLQAKCRGAHARNPCQAPALSPQGCTSPVAKVLRDLLPSRPLLLPQLRLGSRLSQDSSLLHSKQVRTF